MVETDDESIATDDIVEQTVDDVVEEEHVPEPEPAPEPTPESKAEPEPTPEPEPKAKAKPKKGRPKGAKSSVTKKGSTLVHTLTKAELVKMVEDQHELLTKHKARDDEKEKFINETMTKKRQKKEAKEKKPRTPAQIAATQRMIEARKAKRKAELSETGKEIAEDIDKSLTDKVQEVVTNIIMKPLRALTPERVKKVEALKEPKKPSKFVWAGADAFLNK